MAIYNVRVARTLYYDLEVKADGVAEARQKARDWATKAAPDKLENVFFAAGPFEPLTAHKARQPIAARPANK